DGAKQLAGDGAAEQRGRIDGGALQPTDGGGGAGITADPDHLLGPGPVLHARSDGRRTEGLRTQGDSCAREAGHTGWFLCARPHGPSCVCLVRSGWINTQTSPSGTCPACARPTTGPRSCLARFWENSAGPCPTWRCTTDLGQRDRPRRPATCLVRVATGAVAGFNTLGDSPRPPPSHPPCRY